MNDFRILQQCWEAGEGEVSRELHTPHRKLSSRFTEESAGPTLRGQARVNILSQLRAA